MLSFRFFLFCILFLKTHQIFSSTSLFLDLQNKLQTVQIKILGEENTKSLVQLHEKAYKLYILMGIKDKRAADHLIKAACFMKASIREQESLIQEHKAELTVELEKEMKKAADLFYRASDCLNKEKSFKEYHNLRCAAAELSLDSYPEFSEEIYLGLAKHCYSLEKYEEALKYYNKIVVLCERSRRAKQAFCYRQKIIAVALDKMDQICFSDLGKHFEQQARYKLNLPVEGVQMLAKNYFFCAILAYIYDEEFLKAKALMFYIRSKKYGEGIFFQDFLDLCEKGDLEKLVLLSRSYKCHEPLKKETEILLGCFEYYERTEF